MGCGCDKDKPKGDGKSFTKAVIEINNQEKITLLRKVVIPASLGDETTIPPAIGEYRNVILVYEASKRVYIYSSDGIPTLVAIDPLFVESELERLGIEIEEEKEAREEADAELSNEIEAVASDLEAETAARIQTDNRLQSSIDTHTTQITNLNTQINTEITNRQNADIDLQNQIDAISAASDVKDIVGTYQELQNYDTSGLGNNDIIKVLQDETQDGATTYYRWNAANQTFSLIGEEGPYYTKSETDSLLTGKQDVLEAGENISIIGDTISATDTTYTAGSGLDLTGTEFSVDTSTIQSKLTAGNNISINGNTISATDTTYTAGSGLDLTGTEFSIDNTVALKTDLPTVNNATLTVQKNGTDVATFTANSASDVTANITVPTDTAQLTNTAGYQTASDVQSLISGKQNTLTPGTNIQISNDVISATDTTYSAGNGLNLTGATFSADTDILQTKLTPGSNIQISNGVISSDGPTYSAGTGLDLTGNVFSIDNTVALKSDIPTISTATLTIQRNGTDVTTFSTNDPNPVTANILVPTNNAQLTNGAGYQTASDVQSLITGKQDVLTPGNNIQINGNTISATDTKYSAGSGLNLTGTVFSADTSVLATQTDLAGKQDSLTAGTNIDITSNTISTQTRGIEYIIGTQSASTNVWTGVSTDNGCSNGTLYTGKTIVYRLPYAGTSSAATLNLTLPDGTTTGAKNVKYNTGSNVGNTYGAGCDIFMVYDGTYWKTSAWYDSNNYDRLRMYNPIKAKEAIASGRICIGTDEGYVAATGGKTSDITYPVIISASSVSAGATGNNFYYAYPGLNLTGNKSGWSNTINKMVFLVGTLSGTTFTVDSDIFTQTIPTSEDGKVYIPLGIAYSATNILFYPNNTYWAYKNGEFRPISHAQAVMTGADTNNAGTSGLVPAPAAGDNTKYLSGDGTWKTVSQYALPIATANDLGGIKVGNNLSIDSTTGVLDAVVPTVNNATLTIQKNGTSVGTFTANASSNKSINITVPTSAADVSALPASTKYGASISVSINTTDYKITTTLKDQDGNTLGTAQVIDLPLESVVVSGSYDSTNKKIVLTLQNGNTIDIPVGDLVSGLQDEITSTNKLASDLVDDTNQTNKFVTDAEKTKLAGIAAGAEVNVQANWTQTNTSSDDYIKNKPTIEQTTGTSTTNLMSQKAVTDGLGDKVDVASINLTGQTTTILAQVQALAGRKNYARFICTNNGSAASISDNPNTSYGFTCVAYQTRGTGSSDYAYELFCYSNDGNSRPYYARVMHGTTSIEWKRLQNVALTGSYNDLTNKPTIPTVNNATLTIQHNEETVQTFTANASSNKTANINATKRFKIADSTADFSRWVIALCRVSTTNNTTLNSYSIGTLSFHRDNGLSGAGEIEIAIDNRYSTAYATNVSYASNFPLLPQDADLDTAAGWRPCTFKYNDVWYGGIEVMIGTAVYGYMEFNGATNENVFGVKYYTTYKPNSSTPAVIDNQEIYDSLMYDKWVHEKGKFYFDSVDVQSGTISKGSGQYTATLPNKTGTIAMTSDIPTVNNATLTIQKNGTNVQTFTANQSTNATANITVPTKTSDLTNDSGFITSSGTVSKADQLTNARTIGIGTGVTGTATSFDGTSNITIPVTSVLESYVDWGGKNRVDGDLTAGTMGCIDDFGHNRLAYLPASCLNFAFTRDGGTTWVDYNTTNGGDITPSDADKIKFVTYDYMWLIVGGRTTNSSTNPADERLRIRMAAWKNTTTPTIYMSVKQLLFNVSSEGGSGMKVQIRHRTINNWKNNVDTWTNVGTYDLSGWSGWNSIPFINRFGGGSSQTGQMGEIEMVFWKTTLDASTNKNMRVGGMRAIASNLWQKPSEMASTGRLYTIDSSQNATFPKSIYAGSDVFAYNLYNRDTGSTYGNIGSSSTPWKSLYLSDGLYNGTVHLNLPSTTGTLALTSDAQKFAIGQGSTNPVFDDMTPLRTLEWDISAAAYRPIYRIENTGWTYTNLDITVAYRITVTGNNIEQIVDVVDRWINPISYPITSAMMRTKSTSAATTGFRYLRAVYPTSSYLNNTTYPLGVEIYPYNATARHIKIEVFKDNSNVTWSNSLPAASIYVDSTHNGYNSIETYTTRGWKFRQPSQMYASSAGSASYMSDFEPVMVGSSDVKTGATALVAGHYAFLADDGKVYDISNTTQNIAVGESKVGFINTNINANTAISATYWRAISRPSATQVGYISHDTFALGDRLFLRCTMDANGKIHSDNYLSTTMSAGYTWMPFGVARSATTLYVDTRSPKFYTLDSNGKLTHVDGVQVAGSSTIASYSNGTLYLTNPT